jgi:hypothetical protein
MAEAGKSDHRPSSEPDELEYAADLFRKRFAHCSGALPFYPGIGRALLPPAWTRPALIIPLDGHYVVEDPVVNRPVSWLAERFSRQMPEFLQTLDLLKPSLDFGDLPRSDIDGIVPYFPNSFFGPMDAAALTGMMRILKPHRYIEIGSGISTRFARRAVKMHGLLTKIICIDPAPRKSVVNVADAIINESLLNVDITLFSLLRENDILFFDGSHLCFSGTDCTTFFLEVLPSIANGVHVHVHDIFLPNDYPERIKTRFYNEQQLLATFLFANQEFEVVLPMNYLHRLGHCPEGVSFWLKRIA